MVKERKDKKAGAKKIKTNFPRQEEDATPSPMPLWRAKVTTVVAGKNDDRLKSGDINLMRCQLHDSNIAETAGLTLSMSPLPQSRSALPSSQVPCRQSD